MPEIRGQAPFKGLNLIDDESSLENNEATEALNVNLDRATIKKRDGYTSVASLSDVLGITDYRKLDGSVQQIVKTGTTLIKLTDGSIASLTSGTGMTANTVADFAVYGDRCYMVDGVFRVTDGSAVYSPAITKPDLTHITFTPAAWALTGSGLGGTYDYKFTYKSVAWQLESPASEVGARQELSDQQVAIASIPYSPDARVDKIRIYRRKTSEQETMWFLIAEIANPGSGTTSYTDQVQDEARSISEFAPLSEAYDFDSLNFRHIELHKGVMFLASANGSELYYSLPDRPTVITNKLIIGNDSQHGKITGLLSWQGLLYIFKEDSIWSLDGLTEDTFSLNPITNSMGCYSGHSIVPTDDAVYFLGEDSILGFDGNKVGDVAQAIRSVVSSRNRLRDSLFVGANDKDNRAIIWSYTPAGETTNTECIVLFYGNSQKVGGSSWAKWKFNVPLQCMARVTTNAATMDRKLWYGLSTKIGEPGGDRDDSTVDFSLKWTTGKWDGEVPERYKAWGNFSIEVDKVTGGATTQALRVTAYLDSNVFPLFSRHRNISRTINTTRVSGRSRDIRLEFEHDTATGGCNIISFVLEGQGAGAFRARRN